MRVAAKHTACGIFPANHLSNQKGRYKRNVSRDHEGIGPKNMTAQFLCSPLHSSGSTMSVQALSLPRKAPEDAVAIARDRNLKPETGSFWAVHNLAVIKAGVRSAKDGRGIDAADILKSVE